MLISQVPLSRKNLKFYLNVNFYLIVCLNGSKVNLEIFQLKLEGDLLMLNQFHLRYHAVRLAHTTAMMAQHHFRIPEMSTHGDLITRRRRTRHRDLDTIPGEVDTTPGEFVIQSIMGTHINNYMQSCVFNSLRINMITNQQ